MSSKKTSSDGIPGILWENCSKTFKNSTQIAKIELINNKTELCELFSFALAYQHADAPTQSKFTQLWELLIQKKNYFITICNAIVQLLLLTFFSKLAVIFFNLNNP